MEIFGLCWKSPKEVGKILPTYRGENFSTSMRSFQLLNFPSTLFNSSKPCQVVVQFQLRLRNTGLEMNNAQYYKFSFLVFCENEFWILAWTVSKSASKGFKLTKYPKSRKVSSWVEWSRKRPERLKKSWIILYTDIPCGTYNILNNSKIAHFSVEMRLSRFIHGLFSFLHLGSQKWFYIHAYPYL